MTISYVTSDLFSSTSKALAFASNLQYKMNGGTSKVFKETYPKMFEAYSELCKDGTLCLGDCYVHKAKDGKFILVICAQEDTITKPDLSAIVAGLKQVFAIAEQLEIPEVSCTRFGCGFGGLSWNTVKPELEKVANAYGNVDLVVYNF